MSNNELYKNGSIGLAWFIEQYVIYESPVSNHHECNEI